LGLETVEIVLDMEDHFHVRIPDAAASRCVTVADLQWVIVDLLVAKGRPQGEALHQEVWDGMIAVLGRHGYPVGRIRPESKWIGDITRYG
jgi:hypothetical protein